MFSASDLSKDQIEIIKGWVAEGAQMADVQKRLKNDFGFNVTYMDTRFLSLDLELDFQVEEKESEQLAPDDNESPPVPRRLILSRTSQPEVEFQRPLTRLPDLAPW